MIGIAIGIVVGLTLAVLLWVLNERRFRAAPATTPLALCMDNSGSMRGANAEWRDAFLRWALDRCEVRKQTVTVFFFEHDVPYGTSFPGGRGVKALQIPRLGGGTDYQPVLNQALTCVGPGGHIVLLTDGIASTQPAWREEFNAARKSMGVDVRSIFLDNGHWGDADAADRHLAPVSDSVSTVSTAMTPELVADSLFKETQ